MYYNCRPCFHKVTSLTATDTAVEMTITNNTNISSLDDFDLVLCVNPNSIVTAAPLPFTLTINGTAGIPLNNKYNLPILSNRLCSRKRYYGSYVAETDTPYVILWNTPCDKAYAA